MKKILACVGLFILVACGGNGGRTSETATTEQASPTPSSSPTSASTSKCNVTGVWKLVSQEGCTGFSFQDSQVSFWEIQPQTEPTKLDTVTGAPYLYFSGNFLGSSEGRVEIKYCSMLICIDGTVFEKGCSRRCGGRMMKEEGEDGRIYLSCNVNLDSCSIVYQIQ